MVKTRPILVPRTSLLFGIVCLIVLGFPLFVAAQVLPSAQHLGIDMDKLNPNGGSIALGHPFGMTGARIMTTLINGLEDTGGRYGVESMCVGGGQGMAMVIERL